MSSRSAKRTPVPVNVDALTLPSVPDVAHEHYPFCVVWCPIPLLTWLFPFIGHIAICDSQGRIYDFQGDYGIGEDRMLFNVPHRYWDLSKLFVPSYYSRSGADGGAEDAAVWRDSVCHEVEQYDQALFNVIQHFRRCERYNFFANNCHAFVAAVLNMQPLSNGKDNTFTVCFKMLFKGRFVNAARTVQTLLPFTLIATFFLCLGMLL